MKTCLIVGAGQLGSRHLQGLVKYSGELEIIVFDSSLDSLNTAQERGKEILHSHNVVYTQTWEVLPQSFDLVIVATSANVREQVINQLLEKHHVHFLVLEKVLFQGLDAYQRIHDLLTAKDVTAYVNHPRRMFKSYQTLKESLKKNLPAVYSVVGGNWGIGCNALHFLDLIVYLSGKRIEHLNVNNVHDEVTESPRKGFVEFTGSISGHLQDGSLFSITSFKGEISPITVSIFNNEQRFIVQEGATPQVYKLLKENFYGAENSEFQLQFQSDLTTELVKGLFENNNCSLTSYEEARVNHQLFITALLEKYNKISGSHVTALPIT